MENYEFWGGLLLLVLGMLIWIFGKASKRVRSPLRLQSGYEVLRWFVGMFLVLAGLFLVL